MDTVPTSVIIPLNEEDDDDEEFQADDPAAQCDELTTYDDNGFDPVEMESQWNQDVEEVAQFQEQDPIFPHPPPIQPIRLFDLFVLLSNFI